MLFWFAGLFFTLFLFGLLIPESSSVFSNYLQDYEYEGTVAFPHLDTIIYGMFWVSEYFVAWGSQVGNYLGYPVNVIVGLSLIFGIYMIPKVVWGGIVAGLAIKNRKDFFRWLRRK